MGYRINKYTRKMLALVFSLQLFVIGNIAHAGVEIPNGIYHYTANDLVVKVMGGYVKAQHTWYKNSWSFTRGWNPISRINPDAVFIAAVTYGGSSGSGNVSKLVASGFTTNADQYYPVQNMYRNNCDYKLASETVKRTPTSSSGGTYTATVKYIYNKRYFITFADAGAYTQTQTNTTTTTTTNYHYTTSVTSNTVSYTWSDLKGNWAKYNYDGKLIRYGDRNNVQVSFQYDANGNRTGVFDTFGNQVLWYEYDTSNHLISVRDQADTSLARIVHYNWTNGLLTSVTDVLGNTWTYTYGITSGTSTTSGSTGVAIGGFHLTKITDPAGRTVNIDYYDDGSAKSVTRSDGTGIFYEHHYNKTTQVYQSIVNYSGGREVDTWINADGYVIRRVVNGVTVKNVTINGRDYISTDELGHVTTRTHDEWDNIVKITYPDQSTESWTYDPDKSNVLSMTDERGTVTKYDYDTHGNLITETDAAGLPGQRVTHFTYDSYGNLLTVRRDADANTAESLTTYTYDTDGNVTSESVRVSTTETDTMKFISYDRMGNLLRWQDARNNIWQKTYDGLGNVKLITDPLNHTITYAYDTAGGLVSVTDALGHVTSFSVDINGRLQKLQNADADVTSYAYTSAGLLSSVTDPENKVVKKNQYDTRGRLASTQDGDGNTTAYQYGVITAGNVKYSQLGETDFPTFTRQYQYNNRGWQDQITDTISAGTQRTTKYQFDEVGNVVKATDAEQNATSYSYDALNRKTRITYPDGTTVDQTYDNRDNIISVKNENNVTIRSYVYDQKNRLTQENLPSGYNIQYFYDANDNVIRKIDAKGQLTTYSYDAANRLIQANYYPSLAAFNANNAPSKSVSFSYDDDNRLTGYDDGTTSAVYTYNNENQKIKQVVNYPGGISATYAYTYYRNGLKKTQTGPDGVTYTYAYDNGNQLSSITLPGEGTISYSNYLWKLPTKISLPGGNTKEYAYDALLRSKSITATDSAQNVISTQNYTYDLNDHIKTKSDGNNSTSYSYDNRYRLTSVSQQSNVVEKYTYDNTGNRISSSSTSGNWAYSDSNELKSYANVTYAYDENGSAITKSINNVITQKYTYNFENRLSEVRDGNNNLIASYYYDPFGERLWKDVGGTRTYFAYSNHKLGAEIDASGAVTHSYVYANNYDESPLFVRTNTGFRYFVNNAIGVPQLLIDKNGVIDWSAQQLAFGQITETIGAGKNNIRFSGQYYDEETGLDYNHYRYYDPATGRYLTSDPLGLVGGMNTYAYAGSNPINYIDPTGLYFGIDDAIFAVGGAIVGVATTYVSHLISGEPSHWQDYVAAAVGGAAGGWAALYTGPVGAGAVGGFVTSGMKQLLAWNGFHPGDLLEDTVVGGLMGKIPLEKIIPFGKIPLLGKLLAKWGAASEGNAPLFNKIVNYYNWKLPIDVTAQDAWKMLLAKYLKPNLPFDKLLDILKEIGGKKFKEYLCNQ